MKVHEIEEKMKSVRGVLAPIVKKVISILIPIVEEAAKSYAKQYVNEEMSKLNRR